MTVFLTYIIILADKCNHNVAIRPAAWRSYLYTFYAQYQKKDNCTLLITLLQHTVGLFCY